MNYDVELDDLIMTLIKESGSDIHFSVGSFPTLRVDRDLIPLTRKKELTYPVRHRRVRGPQENISKGSSMLR